MRPVLHAWPHLLIATLAALVAAGCGAKVEVSPDAASPDSQAADAGSLDSQAPDAESLGSQAPDAGSLDTQTPDAASPDAQLIGAPGAFFTYNVCGADSSCSVADPAAAVIENVAKHRPAAFALQEICSGQADEISQELRARNLHYVQRFQNAAPSGWNLSCGGFQGWGNAVFHAGNQLGAVEERAYQSQASPSTRAQNRGYVCVRVPQPDFWACSTHIDTEAGVQRSQVEELKAAIESLATRGGHRVPVVVGGDFNLVPGSDSLNAMFSTSYVRGSGSLFEHDVRFDRSSLAAAATESGRKIDYVFHSADLQATGSETVPATSDHKLLLASLLFPAP